MRSGWQLPNGKGRSGLRMTRRQQHERKDDENET